MFKADMDILKMVDLKNLKKVKSMDIDSFDGKTSIIEDVILLDAEKKDFGDGLKEVRQLKIISANLSKEGDEEFRAGEFVALKLDPKTKEWGYPSGKKSKAEKILNFFKVDNFADLKGKKCMIVKRVNGDKSFLGIHHG